MATDLHGVVAIFLQWYDATPYENGTVYERQVLAGRPFL
jgi:hypothetical protein